MTAIGDNLWRVGEESWSPERASLRQFHRRTPADLHLLGREVPPARHLGLRRLGAARSRAMDVLEASRITPEMVAEHGLSDEEYPAHPEGAGPRAEPRRARHFLGHVVGALQLQIARASI